MTELAAISSAEEQPACGSILIAKVSDLARNVDPGEYDPHYVSIGPYHRVRNQNDPDISREDEKIRSLQAVVSAARSGVTVDVYLQAMKRLIEQAIWCYQHQEFEGISNKDFVRMMLLDACYLLSMFSDINKYAGGRRKNKEPNVISSNGRVLQEGHRSCSTPLVSAAARSGDKLKDVAAVRDVFYLAENQLPFFVIETIYQQSNLEGSVSAAEAFSVYIKKLLGRRKYSVATPNLAEAPGNLLHLLHMHLKPTAISRSSTGCAADISDSMGPWRTATDYYFFAGVKFKNRPLGTDACQSILDVRPVDGGSTLEIPCLNIDGETWRILRNLMALEQHNPGTTGSNVTAYCQFISKLACTASDVDLLSRSGVIAHTCGSHGKVAEFFSELCNGLAVRKEDDDINYLKATWFALDKRLQSRRFRWLAWLRQKYFKNPWLTIGLAAAALGLTCEVVQAVYSVLGYNH